MIYPWQDKEWRQLIQISDANRLPHALLLSGATGIGKMHFAEECARLLLCPHLDERVDNAKFHSKKHALKCHICHLIITKTHPDVLWIAPAEEGHAIKIDQIREVKEFIHQSSFQGQYRIVLIYFAHQMNVNAANALLKTLEEPTPQSLLILVSDHASRLPATILSRCRRMHFPKPPSELALSWLQTQTEPGEDFNYPLMLKLVNGAPLAAMKIAQQPTLTLRRDFFNTLISLSKNQEDPLTLAQNFQDFIPQILDFVLTWMIDLVGLKLGKNENDITNDDYSTSLVELAKRSNCREMINFTEYLQELQRHIKEGINLNKQLVMENIMLRWMGLHNVSC